MTTNDLDILFPSLITTEKDYRRAAAETEALARGGSSKSHAAAAALNRECAAWRNYVNAGGSFSLFTTPANRRKKAFTRVLADYQRLKNF